ncbi:MAG: MBL fold metallo-hydrolase [Clostridia bacterium]
MKIKTLVSSRGENNSYIVSSEQKNAVIIDPSFEYSKFSDYIDENDLTLKYILLTHGHYDHIFSVKKLKEKYGALIVINKEDADFLVNPNLSLVSSIMEEDIISVKADMLLSDMDTISLDELCFTFMHTPGHTPGGSCILLGDTMFSGDTIFKGTVGRCDLVGGNFETLLNSIRTKIIPLKVNYKILPGHSAATDLETEKLMNEYFSLCY